MEIIFHSHANKTHFREKGCAPSLILKVRGFGTRKWPINFSFIGFHIFVSRCCCCCCFPFVFFLREKRFTINYQSRSACFKNICMNNVYLRFIVYAWFNLTCYDAPSPAIPPGGICNFISFPVVYSPPPSSMIDLIYVSLCKSFLEQ